MSQSTQVLIEGLVTGLTPVKRLTPATGRLHIALALMIAIAIAAVAVGLRADVMALAPDPALVLTAGPFLILACAAGLAALRMAQPRVGQRSGGWKWAAATVALLPIGALLATIASPADGSAVIGHDGWDCTALGLALGLLVAAPLAMWLRRGAPTSLSRAGWLTGTAAGSAGVFAYSLHCPFTDIAHVGVWHALPVVLGALAGRWIMPHLVRW